MKTITKLWIGLGILTIISPIGLLLPDKFKAGTAWGEWGADETKGLIGYIPSGLEKLSSLWKAIFPDYAFKGMEHASLQQLSGAYIISALIGMGLCFGGVYLVCKFILRKKSDFVQKSSKS